MVRDVARLSAQPYDLLVVGGGICGLACAYDAAQRGLSVALIERDDFGSATSFNHAKTIHGGLRSLQSGDVRKARASMVERRALARIAPHLVEPLPFLIGTYSSLTRNRLAMRVGFLLDAAVGWDRNDGLDPRLHLPAGRVVARHECLASFPGIREQGLTGGALWHDYQVPEADRLTLAFAQAAMAHGAVLANYVEAVALRRTGQRIGGVGARDRVNGTALEIDAAMTVISAGPWTSGLIAGAGVDHAVPLLKAMNLVTSRPMGPVALGAATDDGRMLLLMPWRGRALIGTAQSVRPSPAGDTAVSASELDGFITEVNHAFPSLGLSRSEVTLVHRGIVPGVQLRDGSLTLRAQPVIRDHAEDGLGGALSVMGVKYTTARGVAEHAIDIVCHKLGRRAPCRTATTRLPCAEEVDEASGRRQALTRGLLGNDEEAIQHLARAYGTAASEVISLARERSDLAQRVVATAPVIRAELVYAVRREMAWTLTDVVVRRTSLGSAGYPGDAAVTVAARIVGQELAWTAERTAAEREELRAFYEPVGPDRGSKGSKGSGGSKGSDAEDSGR